MSSNKILKMWSLIKQLAVDTLRTLFMAIYDMISNSKNV